MIRKINGIKLRNFTDGTTYIVEDDLLETITASLFIPANTFKSNDWVTLDGAFTGAGSFGGGPGTITCKFYWNTTLSTTGAIQIALEDNSPLLGQQRAYWEFSRRLSIRTANGGGSGISLGTELSATGVTGGRTEYDSQSTISNISINWTVDGYLFTTIQQSVFSDISTQQFFKLWTY
jgi:hypothetical protein